MKTLRVIVLMAMLLSLSLITDAQQHPQTRIPGDIEIIRNVEYGKGRDTSIRLDILRPKTLPKDPMPVVVFVHGGGWKQGDKASAIPKLIPLVKKGYFTATINYRLTDIAPFPAQIEDCKCAIRWVRAHAKEYNLDPDRIGVWGGSAGGHLVALLGTSGGVKELEGTGGWEKYSSNVQAVADYFGPSDFLVWLDDVKKMLGSSAEDALSHRTTGSVTKLLGGPIMEKLDVAKAASPTTYIDKNDPPVFIGHGDKDPLVPLKQSQVFCDKLKAKGVEATLHIVKGQGHGFRSPETDRMVADFFDKHLGSKRK